jgi:hypothetical protein
MRRLSSGRLQPRQSSPPHRHGSCKARSVLKPVLAPWSSLPMVVVRRSAETGRASHRAGGPSRVGGCQPANPAGVLAWHTGLQRLETGYSTWETGSASMPHSPVALRDRGSQGKRLGVPGIQTFHPPRASGYQGRGPEDTRLRGPRMNRTGPLGVTGGPRERSLGRRWFAHVQRSPTAFLGNSVDGRWIVRSRPSSPAC